jgi:hypothetical protein
MIAVPIWALAALVLATCIFAVLAWRAQHMAGELAEQLDAALTRIGKARLEAHTNGVTDGYKRGWGEAVTAATKAERWGENVIAATMRVGRLNAPALLDTDETLEIA